MIGMKEVAGVLELLIEMHRISVATYYGGEGGGGGGGGVLLLFSLKYSLVL